MSVKRRKYLKVIISGEIFEDMETNLVKKIYFYRYKTKKYY